MRLFYEGWQMLDSNPTIAIVENVDRNAIANSSVATDELQSPDNEGKTNLSVATDELIDIHHAPPLALCFIPSSYFSRCAKVDVYTDLRYNQEEWD